MIRASKELRFVFVLVAAFSLMLSISFAQEKKKVGLDYQISVNAISLAVTIQDKHGRYVDDLTVADFMVLENGIKQTISYFKHDFAAPLSLTVLLDVSGSMSIQNKLKESKEALTYLLTSLLSPNDEASLLIFADGEVEVAASFSAEKDKFLEELSRTEAYGQTALYDAIAVSPDFANRGSREKRALLLITDGIENDSLSTPEQALEIARRVDVPIYTIGYKIPRSELYMRKYKSRLDLSPARIMATLEKFSLATGGKAFFIDDPQELRTALREIRRELSHQYLIGYISYKSPLGEYRNITVTTREKKYRVRTRRGY